ncbi:MAG: type II toxin-antitoxin system HicB family antitoxin [Mycobacteriales bacterium]
MKTYRVLAERHDKWWLLEVPEIPGTFSQVRRLDQVEEWIRDAISLMLEVPEDSFGVEIDVRLPTDELAELRALKAAQTAAVQAQEETSTRARALVQRLASEGLTRRDIGQVLGMSHQRVQQIAA